MSKCHDQLNRKEKRYTVHPIGENRFALLGLRPPCSVVYWRLAFYGN